MLEPLTDAAPAAALPPTLARWIDSGWGLRGGRFDGVDLVGVDLRRLDLTRAEFSGADLGGALLSGAVLQGACLRAASLRGASADAVRALEADLERVDARQAVFRGAVLRHAVLLEANLQGADLRDADLRGADLRGADLRKADLRGADLSDADLTGALVTGALVEGLVAARACLSRVRDERSVSLLGLHEGGGYAGLPPILIQAGQVTGPVGRATGRVGRALGRVVGRGFRLLSTQLAALRRSAAEGFARRRGEAQVRKAARDARTAERDAEWTRLRAARRAASEASVAERKARRASRSAVLAARRLLRSGDAERLVAPGPRPPSAPTVSVLSPASVSRQQARRVAEREHLAPQLAPLRDAAAERTRRRAERVIAAQAAAEAAVVAAALREAEAARVAAEAEAERLATAAAAEAAERAALVAAAAAAERAEVEAAQAAEAERRRLAALEAERIAAEARREEALEERKQARQRAQDEALARLSAVAEQQRVAQRQARIRTEAQALEAQVEGRRGQPEIRTWPKPVAESLAAEDADVLQLEVPGGDKTAVSVADLPSSEGVVLAPELGEDAGEPVPWWRRVLGGRPAPSLPRGDSLDLAGQDFRQQRLGAVSWPRADLSGADLSGARLGGADLLEANLAGARLESARLPRACLEGAVGPGSDWSGASLRGASLRGVDLQGASLVDADLRGADLREAQLGGADLTGADLRRALLTGASLRGANLASARLSDLDLESVDLQDATLDQADLAGVLWNHTRVRGANLSGALGLSVRERRALAERGARTGEQGLGDLLGGLQTTQVRAALVVFGVGLSAWLGARFVTSPADPQALTERAATERSADPAAASRSFEELAQLSVQDEEKVKYLVEAASLADKAASPDRASALWEQALAAAVGLPGLSADTAVRKALRHLDREEWVAARQTVLPLLGLEGHPAETRARAVLVWQDATAALQAADPEATKGEADPVAALVESLGALPDSVADLYLALAELRSVRAEMDQALEALTMADGLLLPLDQARRIQEARARVFDRGGALDEAAALYTELSAAPDLSAPRAATARLSLADIRQRQGRLEEARALVAPLTADTVEAGVRGRALLLEGRLAEQEGALAQATESYRGVLDLTTLDSETLDEARLSLARVLSGDEAAVAAAVAGLSAEAADEIRAHAALGDARAALDGGRPEAALALYEGLLENEGLGASLRFSAKTGSAEALAALGELDDAVEQWRALLADNPTDEERIEIELQLAQGLLQGNALEEALAAFESLSSSRDPDVQMRGLLGLAGVARVQGERARAAELYQRVADDADDPAYQVQALQEVADLATEEDDAEAALAAWRALLGVVPAGHPAAGGARTAMMVGLADQARFGEAREVCAQAVATSSGVARRRAEAACAELAERAGDLSEARSAWLALSEVPELPEDLAADVFLGAARGALAAGAPEEGLALADSGLEQVVSTALRLPLLSLKVTALQELADQEGNDERLAAAQEVRDALIEEAPALAAPLLIEAAAQARGRGRPDEAVRDLERALALPLSSAERAGALLELADTLVESGRTEEARLHYSALSESEEASPEAVFAAGMGLAEVARRSGGQTAALDRLSTLTPPDATTSRWLLEAKAQVQRDLDDGEGALRSWAALLDLAGDDNAARVAALRGAADAHVSLDDPASALPLYEESARLAQDPVEEGWARLGAASVQAALGQSEPAQAALASLAQHADPEVALQARLEQARVHATGEQWGEALAAVEGAQGASLGPSWDASVVEVQAAALVSLDRPEAAMEAWQGLVARWPEAEEARLPAWLGLAEVARQQGDLDAARTWAERARDAAEDPAYRVQAETLVGRLVAEEEGTEEEEG